MKTPVTVRLIRGGEAIHTFRTPVPAELTFDDPGPAPGRRTYYRLDVRGAGAALVANPVFVTVEG